MNMEEIRLERLYEVLERLEKEGDAEHAAAVRWAIFTLEQSIKRG